ncbi:PD-(D/E)XK nuclease family protein [Arcobacter roscoffensis]|uniref:PD-(D/E)XK nuclease family protein n=1 Tax=Arcobacter roscoffensis TaxID=2961520 RepID=A0ABY5E4Q3_9BACT|nr:PD-(D/E)XK nuclease family protein [Arcobacter roscoffensis]UTJ05708.1 PD-(D/E)XK nuclease family protein [Arcobacter roscoffensis]
MFLSEQEKQKQRGLNDYNIVNLVRKENAEVGMHSNVIYSLIDPNGLHDMSTLNQTNVEPILKQSIILTL